MKWARTLWIAQQDLEGICKLLVSHLMQKKELESNIDKKCEEIISYLRDEKKVFELEKRSEL